MQKIKNFFLGIIEAIEIWFRQKILGQRLTPKGLSSAYYHYLIATGELKEKDINTEYEEAIKEMMRRGLCLTRVQGASLLLIYELKFMPKNQRAEWIEYNGVDRGRLADVLRGYYVEREAEEMKMKLRNLENDSKRIKGNIE